MTPAEQAKYRRHLSKFQQMLGDMLTVLDAILPPSDPAVRRAINHQENS